MFKALIIALAAVAAAVPTRSSSGDNVNQCDIGTQLRCCNADPAGQAGIPIGITANCDELSVAEILHGQCTKQTACCSDVQQNGVVNVACTPIAL